MSYNSNSRMTAPPIKPRYDGLRILLGKYPVLEGENLSAYETLYDCILAAVKPENALDDILARDVVDLTWEVLRLRRLKVALMKAAAHEGIREILNATNGQVGLGNLDIVAGWARRQPREVQFVESQMKQAGLDQEAVVAQTLAAKLDTFERLDRMLMQAEARRNAALREIDRHRSALAERLRAAGKAIEDEFTEVDPQSDASE